MKNGRYERHEGAVERKLDRIIELLERQDELLNYLHGDEMTKPVYELHIWYEKSEPPLGTFDAIEKFDNQIEALEAYKKIDCSYKILMEYKCSDGDVLLERGRGEEE